MGSGMSSSQNQIKVSESVVGQSLASVISNESGPLQYPQNVHAAFDVERYVVDENGLRCATLILLTVYTFQV